MIHPYIVRPIPRIIDYADGVGLIRRGNGLREGKKHTNGWEPTLEQALWKNRQAARCEAAAKLWLNPAGRDGRVDWNELDVKVKWDLAGFIDVKGVEEAHHRLCVQKNAPRDLAYLLVDSSNHPDYAIVGWMWGHEAKWDGWWENPQHGAAFYPPRYFPPMRDWKELFEEVQKRELIRGQTAIAK
jgi:hypothetical protein